MSTDSNWITETDKVEIIENLFISLRRKNSPVLRCEEMEAMGILLGHPAMFLYSARMPNSHVHKYLPDRLKGGAGET